MDRSALHRELLAAHHELFVLLQVQHRSPDDPRISALSARAVALEQRLERGRTLSSAAS